MVAGLPGEAFDVLFHGHVAFAGADVHVLAERDPVAVFAFFVFGIGSPLEVVVGGRSFGVDLAVQRGMTRFDVSWFFRNYRRTPVESFEYLVFAMVSVERIADILNYQAVMVEFAKK